MYSIVQFLDEANHLRINLNLVSCPLRLEGGRACSD